MKERHRWKAPRPKRVDELLAPGQSLLDRMLEKARRIDDLDRQVGTLLDPSLAPHVRVANLRDDTLVLVTPVAAIATRLRMESSRFLHRLHGHGADSIRKVEIRVAPLPAKQG